MRDREKLDNDAIALTARLESIKNNNRVEAAY